MTKNREKFFAKFCDVKKMDLIGRKSSLFQPTLGQWSSEISMFFALWSPFFAHLYDSPPSHNFFLYVFNQRNFANQKIFVFLYTKKCTFLQKKKNRPCIIGVDIEEGKWGFLGFARVLQQRYGSPPGFFVIFMKFPKIPYFWGFGAFFGVFGGSEEGSKRVKNRPVVRFFGEFFLR